MIKIICVAGARPNFVKIAPLLRELDKRKELHTILVHTGQHYDKMMSDSFFKDLEIREPDYNLGIGSGSHAEQTARVLVGFEQTCLKEKPDLVIVVGDVNSTVPCALVAKKMGIKVAHVESGLRSFDEAMPEEVNRLLTDRISDYLFVSEESGIENLKHEGTDDKKIFFVGDIMIDSLVASLGKKTDSIERLGLKDEEYCVVTIHRPSNVDTKDDLEKTLDLLNCVDMLVVWPVHPRTRKNMETFGLLKKTEKLMLLEPLGYLDFMTLMSGAKAVLTDSGGIQEETTYLNIPCLTLRRNTERPSTIDNGTNQLIETKDELKECIKKIKQGHWKKKGSCDLWDGQTSRRIVDVIVEKMSEIKNSRI
jgi:UDP-N-acetylglucosamine 2-epimerase (non-hydrolysing)